MTTTRTPAVDAAGGLLPRAGFIASAITTVCCLGLSAAVSLASSIGATFLTRDATLQPLLAVTLTLTILGSIWTYRRHRSLLPLLLTIAAAVLVYSALYGPLDTGIGVAHAAAGHGAQNAAHDTMHDATPSTATSHGDHDATTTVAGSHGGVSATVLVWIGLAGLLAAQLWDVRRVRRCKISPSPASATGGAR